jgi:hypothetical protein
MLPHVRARSILASFVLTVASLLVTVASALANGGAGPFPK